MLRLIRRLVRLSLLMLTAALLLSLAASGLAPRPVLGPAARMDAVRVPLDAADPGRTRVGALTYLGGVVLTSSDPAFGGYSAMAVSGDRFTLLSDGGNVVRFRMGSDFRPLDMWFGDLPEGPGTGWLKAERDSESMAIDPATGRIWAGFEGYNGFFRYDPAITRAEARRAVPEMQRWYDNGGPETLVRLADGRFLTISEEYHARAGLPGRAGLIFSGDPTDPKTRSLPFAYVPPPGYDPSDAAALPDGRVIVLNRAFGVPSLFTARLTLIDPRGIAPGAVLRGVEIARFERPLLHDNFEALAVTREGDDTILWMASDDNQQWWERSLLLKFRVEFDRR